jgi:hypothetical protein
MHIAAAPLLSCGLSSCSCIPTCSSLGSIPCGLLGAVAMLSELLCELRQTLFRRRKLGQRVSLRVASVHPTNVASKDHCTPPDEHLQANEQWRTSFSCSPLHCSPSRSASLLARSNSLEVSASCSLCSVARSRSSYVAMSLACRSETYTQQRAMRSIVQRSFCDARAHA